MICKKTNSDILYISSRSNHPRQILKQLIKDLKKSSSNKESFNSIKQYHQKPSYPLSQIQLSIPNNKQEIQKAKKNNLLQPAFFPKYSQK